MVKVERKGDAVKIEEAEAVLQAETLAERACRVRLVLTDNDGVLTDTGVYYSAEGESMKRFSIRDGMGVERLRKAGIETAIITGERSECVARRSEKLGLPHLFLGVADKRAYLETVFTKTGFGLGELAYIGDDVNDLAIMQTIGRLGLTGAPADAMPEVKRAARYCSSVRGGHGAFRDFAEWILRLREHHEHRQRENR